MVTYRGRLPKTQKQTKDFFEKGVILTQYIRSKKFFRVVFRCDGLLGLIRSTYEGKYAVDVSTEQGRLSCLTTECTSLREAKNILYVWFEDHNFKPALTASKYHPYRINNTQLSLFPWITCQ